jgi:predicted nucleic acid-binding protein
MEKEALELFKKRIHVKGFSCTDAVSEVVAKTLSLTLISFDSGFEIPTIDKNYWISLEDKEKKRILSLIKRYI